MVNNLFVLRVLCFIDALKRSEFIARNRRDRGGDGVNNIEHRVVNVWVNAQRSNADVKNDFRLLASLN